MASRLRDNGGVVAKVILLDGNTVLREILLVKKRVTIGRRAHNDIVIDDAVISGEHAHIVSTDGDSFIEDLNSTNGVQVNGQPIKKHFLREGDVIELARYRLHYSGNILARRERIGSFPEDVGDRKYTVVPHLRVLTGKNAGKEIYLKKDLTSIGRPDHQVAVITWRDDRFFVTHVIGETCPCVNEKPIGRESYLLGHGDMIDLDGLRLQFLVE